AAALGDARQLGVEVVDQGAHRGGMGLELLAARVQLGRKRRHLVSCFCSQRAFTLPSRRGRGKYKPQARHAGCHHGCKSCQTSAMKSTSRPVAATPMAFVRAIMLGYEKYGVDPSEALRQAQITPAQLRKLEARITAAQMETISGVAMRELDDEALGWFSRKLPWGSYGMLCRASITAPNLGVALKRWCRHHRLLTDDIGLSLSVAGDVAHYAIAEQRRLGALREFCLVTSLRSVHGFACWAIDSRIPLRETSFPFAAPPHHGVYPLLFPGPVFFSAAGAGFSFDAQYLALPLRRDERALRTMLQRALPLTVLQYRRDRLLVQRVRELLRQRASELTTADALSHALHVS